VMHLALALVEFLLKRQTLSLL